MSKRMRNRMSEAAAPSAPVEMPMETPRKTSKNDDVKVEFDGWWALRSGVIPAVHKKEIIKADFKGRKVPMVATIAEFDEALKKYGVKLA